MKRALIIDGSRTTRNTLKEHLRALGFAVCETGNGLEALALLDEGAQPDLALVDCDTPGMSGIDFVRAVRGSGDHSGLRIMMVTSETDIECMLQALYAGVDEYVMKPLTQEIIEDKLSLLGVEA